MTHLTASSDKFVQRFLDQTTVTSVEELVRKINQMLLKTYGSSENSATVTPPRDQFLKEDYQQVIVKLSGDTVVVAVGKIISNKGKLDTRVVDWSSVIG